MKPCMNGMFGNLKEYFSMGPQLVEKAKLMTHNHCEVHCNMIILMLCHCVMDYSDIQLIEEKPLRWD